MPAADEGARAIAILAFHKIGDPPPGTWSTWNYIPTDIFAGFLSLISDSNLPVLSASDLLAGLEEPGTLPIASVMLTFDDGFASMLTVAEPAISGFGYPSVLFVPTGFVGGTNLFDQGNEPEERICDWEQLRELERRGVSIQSHGVSHRSFSDLPHAELLIELSDSRLELEAHVDEPVELLAFPFGDNGRDPDDTDVLIARSGYKAAFLYHGGIQQFPDERPFRLTRVPMGPDSNLERVLEQLA